MSSVVETRKPPHRLLMEMRINHGLSPNDLGREAGISGKTVRLAEAGFMPGPRIQHAIASIFGLKPTEIWPLHSQVKR